LSSSCTATTRYRLNRHQSEFIRKNHPSPSFSSDRSPPALSTTRFLTSVLYFRVQFLSRQWFTSPPLLAFSLYHSFLPPKLQCAALLGQLTIAGPPKSRQNPRSSGIIVSLFFIILRPSLIPPPFSLHNTDRQDDPISQLTSKEYVSQFWGPAK
jgi:hypothetical protein